MYKKGGWTDCYDEPVDKPTYLLTYDKIQILFGTIWWKVTKKSQKSGVFSTKKHKIMRHKIMRQIKSQGFSAHNIMEQF